MANDITLPGAGAVVDTIDTGNGHRQVVMGPLVTVSTDVTRPADTTAYAANDAISNSTSAPTAGGFTLAGLGAVSGGAGILTDLLVMSSSPAGGLQGEVWIFDAPVTNIVDNAAFAISDAEIKTLVAVVPFTTIADTNNSWAHLTGLWLGYSCAGSANLRYLLKAKAAYTPASAEAITVRVKAIQCA